MRGDGTGVFLTDFGLAKNVATGSRYTRTGETLGTPAYMSPEQARGELSELTAASDVWALGCVLYELLSGGRMAFEGDSPAAVIGAVLTARPPPLTGQFRPIHRSVVNGNSIRSHVLHRWIERGAFGMPCLSNRLRRSAHAARDRPTHRAGLHLRFARRASRFRGSADAG